MKTITKLSIAIIIFTILSCSINDSSNTDETNVTVKDIYVCGYEQKTSGGTRIATVWKNGIAMNLTDGSKNAEVRDITVSGNDVYAVGSEDDINGTDRARFWKNGVLVNLVNSQSESVANLVEVIGKDVYIIGQEYENNLSVRKIWKNGVASTLQGNINSIAVNNNDVFTAGSQDNTAKFWKNGEGYFLTNGASYSSAYDIEVKGNDIYIVGEEMNNISVAKLWKNGNASNLSDGNYSNVATDISITGDDVYVLGYENNKGTKYKLWKNGEVIWSKENFIVNALKVVGKDFYMLSNSGYISKIVKNGVPENLSSAVNSYAYELFITTN